MERAYTDLCHEAAQKFLESSTRLHGNELQVESSEHISFDFGVLQTVQLFAEERHSMSAGRVRSDDTNVVFTDAARCQAALNEHAERELARTESLDEADALVRSNAYGSVAEKTVIHQYPLRIHYTYPCGTCGGSGRVRCSGCGGSGKNTCSSCGGSGQHLRQRTVHDSYRNQSRTEHYYESCSSCGGSGSRNCSICGGSGNVTCSDCSGTGNLTRSHTIVTVADPNYELVLPGADVPDFVRDALYKAGLPNLGAYGPVGESGSERDDTHKRLFYSFAASVDFCKMRAKVRETVVQWILYGRPPRIFDAGHALELLLAADLEALRRAAAPGKLRSPGLAHASTKVMREFMESEAHQHMLESNITGKSGDSLREALNRAFSLPYIEDSLTSLRAICTSACRWSMLKWTLAAGISAYLAVVAQVVTRLMAKPGVYQQLFTGKNPVEVNYTNLAASGLAEGAWDMLMSYGLGMAAVALLVSVGGHFWRKAWLARAGGKVLQRWAMYLGLCRNRWFVSTVLGVGLAWGVAWVLPVWVNSQGQLFGVFRLDWLIS